MRRAPKNACELMVEQTNACKGHCHTILIASGDYMVIAHATTSLCYILHTTLVSTLYIVAKGEESVRT